MRWKVAFHHRQQGMRSTCLPRYKTCVVFELTAKTRHALSSKTRRAFSSKTADFTMNLKLLPLPPPLLPLLPLPPLPLLLLLRPLLLLLEVDANEEAAS